MIPEIVLEYYFDAPEWQLKLFFMEDEDMFIVLCIFSTVAADDLAMQGTRSSARMVMT